MAWWSLQDSWPELQYSRINKKRVGSDYVFIVSHFLAGATCDTYKAVSMILTHQNSLQELYR